MEKLEFILNKFQTANINLEFGIMELESKNKDSSQLKKHYSLSKMK